MPKGLTLVGRRSNWPRWLCGAKFRSRIFVVEACFMPRASDSEKVHVRRWTVALLIALGSVLILLYVAARLLLSLE